MTGHAHDPNVEAAERAARAVRAARIQAMLDRWEHEPDDPAEPNWEVEQVEPVGFAAPTDIADDSR